MFEVEYYTNAGGSLMIFDRYETVSDVSGDLASNPPSFDWDYAIVSDYDTGETVCIIENDEKGR